MGLQKEPMSLKASWRDYSRVLYTHLQHSSSQVDRHKDGRQGCVATLHEVDGVEENQVTGDG